MAREMEIRRARFEAVAREVLEQFDAGAITADEAWEILVSEAEEAFGDEKGLSERSPREAHHQENESRLLYHNHDITHIVFSRTPAGPEVYLLRRDGSEIPVYQKYVYHSPTGLEWGYPGSGPADLALNILAKLVGLCAAKRLYQQFKWAFIAAVPHEGGSISISDVIDWLNENGIAVGEGVVHA